MRVVLKARDNIARPIFMSRNYPLQQDGKDFVRIDKTSVFSGGANAVRIAICDESGMAFFFDYNFLCRAHVRLNGLRIDSGKKRIDFIADLHILNAALG